MVPAQDGLTAFFFSMQVSVRSGQAETSRLRSVASSKSWLVNGPLPGKVIRLADFVSAVAVQSRVVGLYQLQPITEQFVLRCSLTVSQQSLGRLCFHLHKHSKSGTCGQDPYGVSYFPPWKCLHFPGMIRRRRLGVAAT